MIPPMNPVIGPLNRLFHLVRRRAVAPTERGEYSGGYYAAAIRATAADELRDARGVLLDVGCGEGLLAERLLDGAARRILALDPWEGILERMRARLAGCGVAGDPPALLPLRADGARLPLSDGSVDAVACVNLLLNLERFDQVERTLAECARVLRPGGRLVFDLRNRRNLLHLVRYRLARLYDETIRTPLRAYAPGRIERLLADHGLRVERRIGIGFPARSPVAPIFVYVVRKPASGDPPPARRHPPVGFPVRPADGLRLLLARPVPRERMEARLAARFDCPALLCGTGQTALWLELLALRANAPGRDRVLLPAYTAPSVFVTIRSTGLEPVPVDLDPATFAMAPDRLAAAADRRTLAVVHVHPFGVPVDPAAARATAESVGAALLEDNAQGLGAMIAGRHAGTPLGFASLNRGKNLPVEGGGLLFCAEPALMAEIRSIASRELRAPGRARGPLLPLFCSAFAFAAHPEFYGRFRRIVDRFKQTAPPAGVEPLAFTDAQATLLALLLPRLEPANAAKARRAALYLDACRRAAGFATIRVGPGVRPAWNRFPLLCPDPGARDRLIAGLAAIGVEASRLYEKSIPEHFALAHAEREWPGAVAIGRRLVTLPVQPALPLATAAAVARMIGRG